MYYSIAYISVEDCSLHNACIQCRRLPLRFTRRLPTDDSSWGKDKEEERKRTEARWGSGGDRKEEDVTVNVLRLTSSFRLMNQMKERSRR